MAAEAPESNSLLARAAEGDGDAWGALLAGQQERLTRIVAFRMDPRLRGRIDAADVVQDVFVEASEHRTEYFRTPTVPLFLWLRGVVSNKLLEIHRYHLGTCKRDANRELPLDAPRQWDDTSAAICENLTGHLTSPSIAAARVEVKARLFEALNNMNATDREVLALRHFEQLTSAEAAKVLGIHEEAAAKRYLRALVRLKLILSEMPGGLTEVRL
jgi:RNA polymerase sigma-70 factor, ECF subfamily